MSEHDPLQSLWTQQKQEPFAMSLADIHERAERFRSRIRVRNWIEYGAGAIVIFAFGMIALATPDLIVRIGVGLVILGVLYVSWNLATRAGAARKDDASPALSWAEFHRAQLARQRDALASVWRWYLGPLVPGVAVVMLGSAVASSRGLPLWAGVAVAALGFAWVAAVFFGIAWLNARAAQQLDAEIAALDRARAGG
jgi:hypothetical protein